MNIGVLGGGQLGRMLAIEARQAGHVVVIRTDESPGGPAGQVADDEVCGPYANQQLNELFLAKVDVVTAEFENLPADLLRFIEERRPLHPGSYSLSTCQHRATEKAFLRAHNISHADYEVAESAEAAVSAFARLGAPAIMKSAAFGYDGKGQVRLGAADDAGEAFSSLAVPAVVIEQFVPFVREISVVGARGTTGEWVSFHPGENHHVDGILETTLSPAQVANETAREADRVAHHIATSLQHVGTLGVEFFVLADGSLVVNEIAPRPHNSGHHTIDACSVSQFGLQLRAITGQPLGRIEQAGAAVMINLLGDVWSNGDPQWQALEAYPYAHLHLYGKTEPRPGRKMGHVTVVGDSPQELLQRAKAIKATLAGRNHL